MSHKNVIRLRCTYCDREKTVSLTLCLKSGWPSCCGRSMDLVTTRAKIRKSAEKYLKGDTFKVWEFIAKILEAHSSILDEIERKVPVIKSLPEFQQLRQLHQRLYKIVEL